MFRPSNGNFYEMIGGTQTVIASFGAGASADIPLTAPLSDRMPQATDPLSTGGGAGTGTGTGTTGTGTGTTGTSTGTTGTGTGTTGTGTGTTGSSTGSSVIGARFVWVVEHIAVGFNNTIGEFNSDSYHQRSQTQAGEEEGPPEEADRARQAKKSPILCPRKLTL